MNDLRLEGEVSKILKEYKELDPKKIPIVVRKCPKCLKDGLEYDPDKMEFRCKYCGFSLSLMK